MDINGPTELSQDVFDRVLTDSAIANLNTNGSPIVIAAGNPIRAVWANGAAQALFRSANLSEISARAFHGSDSKSRLAEVSNLMRPGAQPRLERVRLLLGRNVETLTFACRRTEEPNSLFVMAAMGARPGLLVANSAPPVSAALTQSLRTPEPSVVENTAAIAQVAPCAGAALPSPAKIASFAEVEARLSEQFHDASVVRFLWKTDSQHHLAEITGQLCEVVGCESAHLIGQDFVAIAKDFDVDAHDRLISAFARRETWSGLNVLWPVARSMAAVPVTLGALPCFNNEQKFDGFRGFGVVHIQRLEPFERAADDVGVAPASVADVKATEPPPAIAAPPLPAETIPPAAILDDEADALDRELPAAEAEQTPRSSSNVVSLRSGYRVIAPPTAANDSGDALPKAPSAEIGQRHEPQRPLLGDRASESVELTVQERSAFREIARVLGAKAEASAEIPRSQAGSELAPKELFSETPTVPETRGLRIRDLIDVAVGSAVPEPAQTVAEPAQKIAAAAFAATDHADILSSDVAALLDRLPVGILVSRMEIPIYLNKTLLEILDYPDADAYHAAGGLDRMFRGRQPEQLSDAASGGAIPIITRSGDVASVISRVQSIDWNGAPASMMTFRQSLEADLTPRVRSLEGELRHRDGEMRDLNAILDTATDGVAVLDADGLILSLNKSAEALFGYDQNEVAGENFIALLAKESHAVAQDYLAGLKENGVASVLNDGRDVVGRARQGGSIPMFMTLGRVSSVGAQKFCAVLRDMTAWKKAERELSDARREAERASALKSDFLAKVSHEVRTPLNAIIGFAEVIMEERFGPVGNERYKDYLKDIHSSGIHVMSLVNDLLDLSKIEAGKLELNFGSVDANKIISECVSIMQPQATQERVVIRQSLAQRLPNIVADERSLRQIVLNLLSNAVKFNEAGGQVIISTALTDAGHAVIRIKDTGIGMSEAEVQTALEPFRRLQTSRARGGTGLGLPLTKSLVDANRASFTIKSKKMEGTLVEVAFPPTRVLAE